MPFAQTMLVKLGLRLNVRAGRAAFQSSPGHEANASGRKSLHLVWFAIVPMAGAR